MSKLKAVFLQVSFISFRLVFFLTSILILMCWTCSIYNWSELGKINKTFEYFGCVPWALASLTFLGRTLLYTFSNISLRVFNFRKCCCKESSLVNAGSFSTIQNLHLPENKCFAEVLYSVISKCTIPFSLPGLSMTTSLRRLFNIK